MVKDRKIQELFLTENFMVLVTDYVLETKNLHLVPDTLEYRTAMDGYIYLTVKHHPFPFDGEPETLRLVFSWWELLGWLYVRTKV